MDAICPLSLEPYGEEVQLFNDEQANPICTFKATLKFTDNRRFNVACTDDKQFLYERVDLWGFWESGNDSILCTSSLTYLSLQRAVHDRVEYQWVGRNSAGSPLRWLAYWRRQSQSVMRMLGEYSKRVWALRIQTRRLQYCWLPKGCRTT